MITYRQLVILKAIKDTPSLIGVEDLKRALLKSNRSNKYDDNILKSELKELKEGEYVSYSVRDNTIIWLKLTPRGHAVIKEFWKKWFFEKGLKLGTFIAKDALVPIIVSIITAIITTKFCVGGTT